MKNVKFKLNKSVLDKVAQQATVAYVQAHRHECAICHKPIDVQEKLPDNALPVCADCAKTI